jgi:hypothetical protein
MVAGGVWSTEETDFLIILRHASYRMCIAEFF